MEKTKSGETLESLLKQEESGESATWVAMLVPPDPKLMASLTWV